MPATSKSQQRFFGIVHAIQSGKLPPSAAHGKARDVAKHISPQDATDFAKTKHKGLPKKASFGLIDLPMNGRRCNSMSRILSAENPFTALRMVKQADLQGALSSAEKALRSAEQARRKSLEDHIKVLGKDRQKLQQQVAQTSQAAAQTSAQAAALVQQPGPPPAAQPQYGAMLMQDPNATGQNAAGQQPQGKPAPVPKLPGQPAGM